MVIDSWKISSRKETSLLSFLNFHFAQDPFLLVYDRFALNVIVFPEQKPLVWLTCVLRSDGFSYLAQACNPKITLELGMERCQGMDTAPCNTGIDADQIW